MDRARLDRKNHSKNYLNKNHPTHRMDEREETRFSDSLLLNPKNRLGKYTKFS